MTSKTENFEKGRSFTRVFLEVLLLATRLPKTKASELFTNDISLLVTLILSQAQGWFIRYEALPFLSKEMATVLVLYSLSVWR